MARPRGPSQRQVARAAGVSPTTVSFVLNGLGDQAKVAKTTQARVREAAERLHYIPNSAARAIVGQRYLTVGIITLRPQPTLHQSNFEDFVVGAIDEATRHGHNVKLLPPVVDAEAYDVPGALRDAHVDAVIVRNLPSVARAMAEWSVPTVYVGTGMGAKGIPFDKVGAVTVAESAALRKVARHLKRRGHTQVAIITGSKNDRYPPPRLTAFAQEFQRGPETCVVGWYEASDWSPEAGYQLTRVLLAEHTGITALHAGNDWMATGTLRALHQAGARIPQDFEVVGFGDFRVSAYLEPPLTTVRWPLDAVARRAITKLIAQMEGQPGGRGHTRLPADLIVRESSPA